MLSQLRFAMHPLDETDFVKELPREPDIAFIDGTRWKTPTPETTRDISKIGSSCVVWSPADLAVLSAEFIASRGDWYSRDQYATIEFSRSRLLQDILIEGRIAVGTTGAPRDVAAPVERRYRRLVRYLKKGYKNGAVRWFNPHSSSTSTVGSPNPSNPDNSLWIGPAAIDWLLQSPNRRIKQGQDFRTEAFIG